MSKNEGSQSHVAVKTKLNLSQKKQYARKTIVTIY